MEQIFREYSSPFEQSSTAEPDNKIKAVCAYMEDHFSDNISLDDLTALAAELMEKMQLEVPQPLMVLDIIISDANKVPLGWNKIYIKGSEFEIKGVSI